MFIKGKNLFINEDFSKETMELRKQFRSSRPEVFLKISQNSQENTCARVSFLIKLQACNFIKKETLAQVFSCEFQEIFKNTFSDRTPQAAASDNCGKK